MAVPDFQSLMLPVLRAISAKEIRSGDVMESVASTLGVTADDRAELLPSGLQTTFVNRVSWAISYLGRAGLIRRTQRSHYEITPNGTQVLAAPPQRIDIRFLQQFPEFVVSRAKERSSSAMSELSVAPSTPDLTPDEAMRIARNQVDDQLGADLLQRIMSAPPEFFEKLVVRLLTTMGYGGSVESAGRALGRSGDGGVDGVIDEDALGLDRIYVQAKRYAHSNRVGPAEIRDFFGALDQFKAGKGLFVTTSRFTEAAERTAQGLSKRIVLIDGDQLARLMTRHNVGCRIEETFHLKKVDDEFFDI